MKLALRFEPATFKTGLSSVTTIVLLVILKSLSCSKGTLSDNIPFEESHYTTTCVTIPAFTGVPT